MPDKNWQFELEEYIKVYLPNLPAYGDGGVWINVAVIKFFYKFAHIVTSFDFLP